MGQVTATDLFKKSMALSEKTAKEAGGEISKGAEALSKLRMLRRKKLEGYARKEALTGKLSKKDIKARQELKSEEQRDHINERVEFLFRDQPERVDPPSDKRDDITPAERKLLRLKRGKKDLDIA